jgi:hypothetical protein
MQVRIDIEALEMFPERARSAARLDDHHDADDEVVAGLAALGWLLVMDRSRPGGAR